MAASAFASIDFQRRCRKTRSRSTSSAEAPSAAVRTMIAALLRRDRLDDVAQADALVVVEASGDAQAFAARDEDDEAARERDLGRQPRALRLHRVLDRLDEDLLVALQEVLDLAAAAALELGRDDLVDVQEAVLLEADLDERGLHAREDVVDGALVDVAGDRAALRALEVDLGGAVVLEDGDALLADVDRDEELALRLRKRRAAGRLAAALLLALGALAALALAGLALGLLLLGRLGLFLGGLGGRRRAGRLAPIAAAAGSAPPPRSCRCGLCARLSGRLGYCWSCGWWCSFTGCVLLARLAPKPVQQTKSPCVARAQATPEGRCARSVCRWCRS